MKTLLLVHLVLLISVCKSLPLSTRSRWIVDEHGGRVKLACVNWAGHLDAMLPEGLEKQRLTHIVDEIASMGFNCVRLTYATYMYTRHANVKVADSLRGLGLKDALVGMYQLNRGLLQLSVVDAQRAVIDALARKGVMVILDNHVSQPQWCCGNTDGNGFFGDKYFDPNEWLSGLHIAATRYKDTPAVVGMSLRNELRGPRQNDKDWYKYVEQGARRINTDNPKLLILISGLNYDLNLGFLNGHPLNLNIQNKIVYEIHRYAFDKSSKFWSERDACGKFTGEFHSGAGFLTEGKNAAPLFVTEFGINQAKTEPSEIAFRDCFLGYLAQTDLDWGVWALQGSYYIKDGVHVFEETYGMLDSNWGAIRNPDFLGRLRTLMKIKLNSTK
ncbi:hypothetical protein ACS0TY_004238 [Phlomoides rotata]